MKLSLVSFGVVLIAVAIYVFTLFVPPAFGGLLISTVSTSTFPGVINAGNTNSTSTFLGVLSADKLDASSLTASSTFAQGINIAQGCFAINGNCLTLGSFSGTLAVAFGGTGAATFNQGFIYSAGGTGALSASTSAMTVDHVYATSTATSTFAGGVNITGTDCFAIQGTCLQTYIQNATAYKQAVSYATAAVLPGTPAYNNGSSGVGATLTEVGFGALVVDGQTVTLGQRILVKDQADATQNGIYTVSTVGSVIANYVLTRSTDYHSSVDIYEGTTVPVLVGGTANGDTQWTESTTGTIVIGTSNIAFIETSIGSAAVPNSLTLTVAGTANQVTSSAGAQSLAANRTWTLSLPSLVVFPSAATTTLLTVTDRAWFGTANALGTTRFGLDGRLTMTALLLAQAGATTSQLTVLGGNTWLTGLTSALLGTDNTGKVVATTTVGGNYIAGPVNTASALFANGANCSAGQFPLGVDASGAVETCTDAWTEAENTTAAYAAQATTLTVAGTANQVTSSAGAQSLAANRTWTLSLAGPHNFTTLTDNRVLTGNGTSAIVDEANLTFDGSTLSNGGGNISITPNNGKYLLDGGVIAMASTSLGSYYFGNSGNTALTASGTNNLGFGNSALSSLTSGISNAGFGAATLQYNTTGNNNTAFGQSAMQANTTGYNNASFGYLSGLGNTTGSTNIFFGTLAGYGDAVDLNRISVIDTGMTLMGGLASRAGSVASTSVMTNGTAIGYNAQVGCSNCLVLGDPASIKVGIGSSTPLSIFSIQSSAPSILISDTGGAMTASLGNVSGFYGMNANRNWVNGAIFNSSKAVASMGMFVGDSNSYVSFSTGATNGVNASERMRVTSTGNVGIGTTTPGSTLTVKADGTLAIPYDTAASVARAGEVAIDTTSDQYIYYGLNSKKVLGNGNFYRSFFYATTTTWVATTTIQLGPRIVGETWNSVSCYTNTGTLNFQFSDQTNSMTMFNGSTTANINALTTNNTYTAGEKAQVVVGTPATSPTSIACTVSVSITAD